MKVANKLFESVDVFKYALLGATGTRQNCINEKIKDRLSLRILATAQLLLFYLVSYQKT
jgi:hypothetical protein